MVRNKTTQHFGQIFPCGRGTTVKLSAHQQGRRRLTIVKGIKTIALKMERRLCIHFQEAGRRVMETIIIFNHFLRQQSQFSSSCIFLNYKDTYKEHKT